MRQRDVMEDVAAVNDLYPADVVAHCRPAYGLDLLARANADAREYEAAQRAARAADREGALGA